jgi:hypothetical protein
MSNNSFFGENEKNDKTCQKYSAKTFFDPKTADSPANNCSGTLEGNTMPT